MSSKQFLLLVLLLAVFSIIINGCGFIEGCGEAVAGAGDDLQRLSKATRNHMYGDEIPSPFIYGTITD